MTPYDGPARDPVAASAWSWPQPCWSRGCAAGTDDELAPHPRRTSPRRPASRSPLRPATMPVGQGDVAPADVVWAQGSVLHVGRRQVDLGPSASRPSWWSRRGVRAGRGGGLVHRPVSAAGHRPDRGDRPAHQRRRRFLEVVDTGRANGAAGLRHRDRRAVRADVDPRRWDRRQGRAVRVTLVRPRLDPRGPRHASSTLGAWTSDSVFYGVGGPARGAGSWRATRRRPCRPVGGRVDRRPNRSGPPREPAGQRVLRGIPACPVRVKAPVPLGPPTAGAARLGFHRHRHRPRDPGLARQPHRRGRGAPRRRLGRPGRRTLRRVHRRLRGRRAARRRQRATAARAPRRQSAPCRTRSSPRSSASTPATSASSTRRCSTSTAPPTRPTSAPTRSSASRSPWRARPRSAPSCRCSATSAAPTPTCCRCR